LAASRKRARNLGDTQTPKAPKAPEAPKPEAPEEEEIVGFCHGETLNDVKRLLIDQPKAVLKNGKEVPLGKLLVTRRRDVERMLKMFVNRISLHLTDLLNDWETAERDALRQN
jgi:hypothetical protein